MKTKIRKDISVMRSAAKSELKDEIITKRVMNIEQLLNADIVLLYASYGSEVNTWKIADDLLHRKILIAFPRCYNNGKMKFHCIQSLNDLGDGSDSKYGICEPDCSLPIPNITDSTVCIVPGLAFTKNGDRLGYGGGYYDRFLSNHFEIYTIAPAYKDIVINELPLSQHDIKIKTIVTEEKVILCNA